MHATATSPPRRRFQLHLLTCVALMLVAGVLLKLNLDAAPEVQVVSARLKAMVLYGIQVHWRSGFPWTMNERVNDSIPLVMDPEPARERLQTMAETQELDLLEGEPDREELERYLRRPERWSGEWRRPQALLNLAVALVTLMAIALCCEVILRRRDAKKPSALAPPP